MSVIQVDINGETYNVGYAKAKQQKTLLTLVGAICAYNSSAADIVEIDVKFLRGVLLSLGDEKLTKVEEIVFAATMKDGETTSVTINHFPGQMAAYLELVAHGIKHNLQDFFTYLDEERAAQRPAETAKTQA